MTFLTVYIIDHVIDFGTLVFRFNIHRVQMKNCQSA